MKQSNLAAVKDPDRIFKLAWCVNNVCTNHCSYCPDLLHRGKNHCDWADVERFSKEIIRLKPKIALSITGGEPTVSPWLRQLIELFKSAGHYVGLTSNGVRSGSYWDQIRPDYLCLSHHAAWADDQWLNRAVEQQERIPETTVRVMMDPINWSKSRAAYDHILANTQLGLEAVQLQYWGAARPVYSREQLEWIKTADVRTVGTRPITVQAEDFQGQQRPADSSWTLDLINRGENSFTGWQCDIGLDSLFVQFDGSYRRGNCDQGDYLGWIQQTPKLPREPVICQQALCQCTLDIQTSKRIVPIYPYHTQT